MVGREGGGTLFLTLLCFDGLGWQVLMVNEGWRRQREGAGSAGLLPQRRGDAGERKGFLLGASA